MPPVAIALLLLLAAYLVGGIPFGYLIGQLKGVDLFAAGSGNIGATNAGRVLGRKVGILVFVLDFLKGAIPVAAVLPLAKAIDPATLMALGSPEILQASAAALAFLGHLFPIYLRFRGGKGVATSAGALFVLVPGPAVAAIVTWVAVVLASRYVSLASLAAASALVIARFLGVSSPLESPSMAATLFCVAAAAMVYVRHRANVKRLINGTENHFADGPSRQTLLRGVHIFAVGVWFGGAAFFNFGTALPIFASFKQVVADGPSDRTAYQSIIPQDASQQDKDALASALAGAAVGPVFPRYFAMQALCAIAAVCTAYAWRTTTGSRVHHWRFVVLAIAAATVAIGWPISVEVTHLRLARFDPDAVTAAAAKAAFGPWHVASLILSLITTTLASIALALAAKLPTENAVQVETPH